MDLRSINGQMVIEAMGVGEIIHGRGKKKTHSKTESKAGKSEPQEMLLRGQIGKKNPRRSLRKTSQRHREQFQCE